MTPSYDLHLNLIDAESNPSELQNLTRELARTLERQGDITANLPEGTPAPGKRGDPLTIGTVLLQLAGAGGVIVSLIGVLKSYVERKPTLDIELQRADGAKLKLKADTLQAEQVEKLRELIERFLDKQP